MASPEHRARLSRALEIGQRRGLGRGSMFPPFLRALSGLGVPIRPLHFLPVPLLLLFSTLFMGLIFLGVWCAVDYMNASGIRKFVTLHRAGPQTMAAIGVVTGMALAIVIRFQTISRDLPRWRDL